MTACNPKPEHEKIVQGIRNDLDDIKRDVAMPIFLLVITKGPTE
jgi:hypothetical protein